MVVSLVFAHHQSSASSAGLSVGGFMLFGAITLFCIAAYFLPTVVGAIRHVPNLGSVGVINFFLGWTFVGWIVAMAMAARSQPQPQVVFHQGVPWQPPAPGLPPVE
jgi:hypothetical protein